MKISTPVVDQPHLNESDNLTQMEIIDRGPETDPYEPIPMECPICGRNTKLNVIRGYLFSHTQKNSSITCPGSGKQMRDPIEGAHRPTGMIKQVQNETKHRKTQKKPCTEEYPINTKHSIRPILNGLPGAKRR